MNAISRKVLKNIKERERLGKFSPQELAERHKKRMAKNVAEVVRDAKEKTS